MTTNSYEDRKFDDPKKNVTVTLDKSLVKNIELLKKNKKLRQISPLINELIWREFKEEFEGKKKKK